MREAWLTRRRNGDYLLTQFPPSIAHVALPAAAGRLRDAYIRPGDPLGIQLCAAGVQMELGKHLEHLTSRKVLIRLELLAPGMERDRSRPTAEVRGMPGMSAPRSGVGGRESAVSRTGDEPADPCPLTPDS